MPYTLDSLLKTATPCSYPFGMLQGPRVTQTAVMSAVFFTLFEVRPPALVWLCMLCQRVTHRTGQSPKRGFIPQFWKAQLKRDRKPEDMLLRPKIWRKRRSHVWKRQFVYN